MFNLIFLIILILALFAFTIHGVYVLGFEKRYYGPSPELSFPCLLGKGESKFIKSFDGCRLKAEFYSSPQQSPYIVILLHGYRCKGSDMAPIAEMYIKKFGFNVLVPDLRAHGKTGGKCIGFGMPDGRDVCEWIKYAENMTGGRCRVILHGISMGGSTALFAASFNHPSVLCVISDCAYCSAADMVCREIVKNLHIPPKLIVKITNIIVKIKGGYSIYDCAPQRIADKIKCPALIIHGGADEYIPPSNAYRLAALIRSECEVYICEGAIHAGSALKNPAEYERRIRAFLSHI